MLIPNDFLGVERRGTHIASLLGRELETIVNKRSTACVLALMTLPLAAHAGIIIDGSTTGRYNSGLGDLAGLDGPGGFFLAQDVSEGDPTRLPIMPEPSVSYGGAFGADWLHGNYTGGAWSAGPVAIPASWAINAETAIVYEFTLSALSSLHIDLGVDNGILIWLNGNYIFGAQAGGGSSLGEYDIDVASLGVGTHRLQILREDHGGSTGYDIQATTTVRVPEPTTLSLLGIGLLALGFARRRKAKV